MNQQLENTVHTSLQLLTSYGMSMVGAVVILTVGWIGARFLHNMALKAVLKSGKIDQTVGRFFADVARYAVLVFTIIAVLAKFGVQTASIITVLGALGLAVGFALQGTLSNVAAGLVHTVPEAVQDRRLHRGGGNLGHGQRDQSVHDRAQHP